MVSIVEDVILDFFAILKLTLFTKNGKKVIWGLEWVFFTFFTFHMHRTLHFGLFIKIGSYLLTKILFENQCFLHSLHLFDHVLVYVFVLSFGN